MADLEEFSVDSSTEAVGEKPAESGDADRGCTLDVHRRWKLRPMASVSVGPRMVVFATRSCCGPGGVGRCQSHAEGLPCGTTRLLERVPLDPAAEERAEELRRLRISLGIGLRAASAGLVLTPVELSQLERAKLDVDDWSALFASLRTLGERR